MDLISTRFISPTDTDPADVVATLTQAAMPPSPRHGLDAGSIGRAVQARTGRLSNPTDAQLARIVRDAGIAAAVAAGWKGKKVAELMNLPPARVSTIVAQIRADAAASATPDRLTA